MRRPLVVAIPSDAVAHLMDLVVAEQLRLDGVERSWPEARTWPLARDRALDTLKRAAELGEERSARTLDALIQACFDVEYLELVSRLGRGWRLMDEPAMPEEAKRHLLDLIFEEAEMAGVTADPESPTWPKLRERATRRLMAEAVAGDPRALGSWRSWQAWLDGVDFVGIVNASLEERGDG